MSNVRDELIQLEQEIHEEKRLLLENMKRIWSKPLLERTDSGSALGNLTIVEIEPTKNLIHFLPPHEDFAFFQAQDAVRLSQNVPESNYLPATFHGLTEKGLTLYCSQTQDYAFNQKSGWSIDEDFIDVSPFYIEAIKQLAETAHGQENVFPTLFGEIEDTVSPEIFDEIADNLEQSADLNESQIEAVATALASEQFHLIQGPPGTGKTHTLAQLVDQLIDKQHKILITGFTHRSIHNALEKIHKISGNACPIVKISQYIPGQDDLPFPVHQSFEDSELHLADGPYVIGATPFALFTSRLKTAHFDSAVIDETSQMNIPSAIMAMLRSDRWFFFGDQKQLPPVSQIHKADPSAASVFSRLAKQKEPTTLNTTYRLNQPLTEWPSHQFYQGQLRAHFPENRLALKSNTSPYAEILNPEHSLISIAIDHPGRKSINDQEADLTAEIILHLIQSGIDPKEIGIVSPFRAQASRIRTLLKGDRFNSIHPKPSQEITVDTVDRFQGQEREIIIYTFTTSDSDFINKIRDFLLMPSRLNVAVTRARTKVILLHSPELQTFAEQNQLHHEPSDIFLTLLNHSHKILTEV